MKLSKENMVSYPIILILSSIIAYLLIGAFVKWRSLNLNLEYSKAVIVRFSSVRNRKYFKYKFHVNEKEYEGGGKYYPKSETISAGDTVFIVYDRTDPDNNKPYRDYE